MKLYVLSSGYMSGERGFLLHFGTSKDEGKEYTPEAIRSQVSQYYIDHPEAKILFDAGWKLAEFSGEHAHGGFPQRRDPDGLFLKQEPDENPIAQLDKIGVKIDDIDYVVISHLMGEHAGWLPIFAGKKAQVVIQRKELEYAQSIGGDTPRKAREDALEQFHSWMYFRGDFDVPGLNYKLIEGNMELVEKEKGQIFCGHDYEQWMTLKHVPEYYE